MSVFIHRASIMYCYKTKEEAEAQKVKLEKWFPTSIGDEEEVVWRPMVYPDILNGATLWVATVVGFRDKNVPKTPRGRERWLKNRIKELEEERLRRPGPIVSKTGPRDAKTQKPTGHAVRASSSAVPKRKGKKEVKKHVVTKKTTRRK